MINIILKFTAIFTIAYFSSLQIKGDRFESEIDVSDSNRNSVYYPEKRYWISAKTAIYRGMNITTSEKWVGFEVWPDVKKEHIDSIKNVANGMIKNWEHVADSLVKIYNNK